MTKEAISRRKSQSAQHGADDQAKAFRKAARELGCEPDEKRFQDALRKVARAKPPESKPKSKRISSSS